MPQLCQRQRGFLGGATASTPPLVAWGSPGACPSSSLLGPHWWPCLHDEDSPAAVGMGC